ncbi:DMT family transporter [Hydrotalea sp.]|uniref:DMT family transporter n=1 Tax=Hydrotalea sp. TaxID=2881279 RepID=UPI00258F175F|nr:DMT family transporter [Hydrotalea sp.]
MLSNTRWNAHAAVLITNLLFGVNYAAVKYITPAFILPFGLNFARVVTALILFWTLFLLKPGNSAGIERKHIPLFVLCGITGVTINQLFFIKGLSLTSSIHASLLALATPIFITFIAAWLLKERLSVVKILGLLMGVSGAVILIAMKQNSGNRQDSLIGDLYILVNAISYAFYMVWVRPLMQVYSALHVMRWIFTFGALFLIPFCWNDFFVTQWHAFGIFEWLILALICVGATFVAYLFNVYGISVIGASATGSYIYTQPVFAAIIAVWLLGEHFTLTKLLAGLCIFIGVFLVNSKKNVFNFFWGNRKTENA